MRWLIQNIIQKKHRKKYFSVIIIFYLFPKRLKKIILSGICNLVVKILITGFIVFHTTEKGLEELHLNFTMARSGKKDYVT